MKGSVDDQLFVATDTSIGYFFLKDDTTVQATYCCGSGVVGEAIFPVEADTAYQIEVNSTGDVYKLTKNNR